MLDVAVLIINFLAALYFIKKRSLALLGYIIFFQEVHLVPFAILELEVYGYIYYVVIVTLYLVSITNLKFSKSWFNFLLYDNAARALILITFGVFIHVLLGVHTEIAGVLVSRYFFQVVPAMIFLVLVLGNNINVDELQKGIMLYGGFLFLILVLTTDVLSMAPLSRGHVKEETYISPIAMSRMGGVLFIAAFFSLFNKNSFQAQNKIFAYVIIGISLVMITLGMSRGPLISLLTALFVYVAFYSFDRFQFFLKASSFIVPVVLVAGFVLINYDFKVVEMYVDRLKELQDLQEIGRYQRYELFFLYLINDLRIFSFEFLWGWGPDGFNKVFGMGYVHNFIMESIFEYGLIGLVFIVLFTFSSFKKTFIIMRSKVPHHYLFIPLIFVMLYTASMFSGDLIARRNLFFISIVQISLYYTIKKNKL